MKIAILGAGNVGGTLGRRWAELGHDVTFGVREGSTREVDHAAPIAEAVRQAEVVVLATPWPAVADALKSAGPLDGKVLFDATNPLGPDMKQDIGPGGESAAERTQRLVPGAKLVKIFNTTGASNMADPGYGGIPITMFFAGDDAGAKSVARRLAADLGFDPVDAGGLVKARELESLAMLWIGLAYGGEGRDIAFKLLRR